MNWHNQNSRGGRPFVEDTSLRSTSDNDGQVHEVLRNIHLSDSMMMSSSNDDDMMGITEREAAEVLLQMGGMSMNRSFRGGGEVGHVSEPQRKSVITKNTQSAQPTETKSSTSSSSSLLKLTTTTLPNVNRGLIFEKPEIVHPVHSHNMAASSSFLNVGVEDLSLQKKVPVQHRNTKKDSQVPISVLQRTGPLSHNSNKNARAQNVGSEPSEAKLVQPLYANARFERDLMNNKYLPEPSSSSKSSSKTNMTTHPQQQLQHQLMSLGQFLPNLSSTNTTSGGGLVRITASSTINSNAVASTTSLLLPVSGGGVGGTLIRFTPSTITTTQQILQPAPITSTIKSTPNTALNIAPLLQNNISKTSNAITTTTNTSIQKHSTITTPTILNGRNLQNSNNSSLVVTTLSNLTLSPEQLLRKKKQEKAEKKALRAQVPICTDFTSDIEVDGFIIPREYWAKAFVQTDLCHQAGILFKALFSTEEIQRCTLRGRNGTSLLNVQKRSAIFRAVGWMKQKNQNPYSFDSSATLYHTHTLTHEERMMIEKKVFVERRYQTSRKIRDYQRPKKRAEIQRQKALLALKLQEELNLSKSQNENPSSINIDNGNCTTKIEEIVVKSEPLDDQEYYQQHDIMTTLDPSTFKKEKDETIPTLENEQVESQPTSPKQPKLDDIMKK